jgi:hypothetical protein
MENLNVTEVNNFDSRSKNENTKVESCEVKASTKNDDFEVEVTELAQYRSKFYGRHYSS